MTCSPLQIALGRLRELHPSGSLASPKSIYRKGGIGTSSHQQAHSVCAPLNAYVSCLNHSTYDLIIIENKSWLYLYSLFFNGNFLSNNSTSSILTSYESLSLNFHLWPLNTPFFNSKISNPDGYFPSIVFILKSFPVLKPCLQ